MLCYHSNFIPAIHISFIFVCRHNKFYVLSVPVESSKCIIDITTEFFSHNLPQVVYHININNIFVGFRRAWMDFLTRKHFFFSGKMPPPAGPSAGTRRPSDSAFKQQKLKAWQPILTPKWVISCFTLVGAIFIPIGIAIMLASREVATAWHSRRNDETVI